MPVVVASGAHGQTAQELWRFHSSSSGTRCTCLLLLVWCRWPDSAVNCGGPAVAVLRSRRFPCRAAETDRHGLACLEDQRDSAVAVCFWTRSCLPAVACELHVQFLDKVDMPSWCIDRCRVQPAVFPPSSAHRCECSRALGVALTPGVELPGVRPLVVHEQVASLAHACRFFHVWTNTCVEIFSTSGRRPLSGKQKRAARKTANEREEGLRPRRPLLD